MPPVVLCKINRSLAKLALIALLSCPAVSGAAQQWLGPPPVLSDQTPWGWEAPTPRLTAPHAVVEIRSRHEVGQLFNNMYLLAMTVPIVWTGDLLSCFPGTTSAEYAAATLDMVNYFRLMAGFTVEITENAVNSGKAQEAALMMDRNNALSHSPPASWACYTAAGAQAAGKSNLSLGAAGPAAVALYMKDPGSGNYFIGHRRWILYPRQTQMGTGSTPGANALWVLTGFTTRPATPEWLAWPPAGFVPYQVIYPRWSFSVNAPMADVDFGSTTVAVAKGGMPIGLSVLAENNDHGYGDDTIVWEPTGITKGPGIADQTFDVSISNVIVDGLSMDYEYQVTIIDPALNTCTVPDDQLDLPFTQTAQVDTYEACTSISAVSGFEIVPLGDVLFRAPTVELGSGFSVEKGAIFGVVSETP